MKVLPRSQKQKILKLVDDLLALTVNPHDFQKAERSDAIAKARAAIEAALK